MGIPYRGYNIEVRPQCDVAFPVIATASPEQDYFNDDALAAEGFSEDHAVRNLMSRIDRKLDRI